MRQQQLFPDAPRTAAAPAPRVGAPLRLVLPAELREGWNEPVPPKRGWVVHHYYDKHGGSLCERYHIEGTPPKAHFQTDAPTEPHYHNVARDWLCKTCLTRLVARKMF